MAFVAWIPCAIIFVLYFGSLQRADEVIGSSYLLSFVLLGAITGIIIPIVMRHEAQDNWNWPAIVGGTLIFAIALAVFVFSIMPVMIVALVLWIVGIISLLGLLRK